MDEEHQEELKIRLGGMKSTLERQKQDQDTVHGKQMDELELEKKLYREEISLQFSKETAAMRDRFNEDQARMQELHRMEIQDYEKMLEKVRLL